MNDSTPTDADLSRILAETRRIAVIGASPDPDRHSHRVIEYMQSNGYRMIPVNPTAAGSRIAGEQVLARLADAAGPIDMVNVFRRPDAIAGVVDDMLPLVDRKAIRFLWLQLGLVDEAAAARARATGVEVVMDRCLKLEYGRLLAHRK